ncbi:MAG: histidine phosphatase family protein [Labilithrix sp.]|nr:histidine phosphatase family protein [Labilithrix sp.]MCW5810717.1 histidine phosphatase family protein [Labilithrix sp.]
MALLIQLARHGETADNARRVFQGQGGSGLNRLGRAQAQRLAERLRHAPPEAIYASDLERAADTARYVAEACGMTVTLDEDLREVDVGLWTGKGYDEIARLYPEEWAAWEHGLDVRRGGGETYAELAARVERAVSRIAARHADGSRVLLVSHGGSIKSWVARLLGVNAEGLRALAGVANTGLTLVERDGRGRHRLHSWNDVAHLDGLVAAEHSD